MVDIKPFKFNKYKYKKPSNTIENGLNKYFSDSSMGMYTVREIKSELDDVFNPAKLHKSYISGRYFIRDVAKFKNVLCADFATLPDGIFGFLEIQVNTLLREKGDRFSDLPVRPLEQFRVPVEAADGEASAIYGYGDYVPDKSMIYTPFDNTQILDYYGDYEDFYTTPQNIDYRDVSMNDINTKNIIPYSESEAAYTINNTIYALQYSEDLHALDRLQSLTATYKFYASNGTTYSTTIKLDDVYEISRTHFRFFTGTKTIGGGNIIALNPDGTEYNYTRVIEDNPDTSGATTVPKGKNDDLYAARIPVLRLFLKSDTNTVNDIRDQFYTPETIKRDFIFKNTTEATGPDDIYNLDSRYILTRAIFRTTDNQNWMDTCKIERLYNTISSSITGAKDFTYRFGAPTFNDSFFALNNNGGNSSSGRIIFAPNEASHRVRTTDVNVYYFHRELYSLNDKNDSLPQGSLFRIEARGTSIENSSKNNSNLTFVTQAAYNGTKNVTIIHPTGSTSSTKITNSVIPGDTSYAIIRNRVDNDSHLMTQYPCVHWYTYPWHSRTHPEGNSALPKFERYKFIQGKRIRPSVNYFGLTEANQASLTYATAAENPIITRYNLGSKFPTFVNMHNKLYSFVLNLSHFGTSGVNIYEGGIPNSINVNLTKS